jgi:hypothetical protein
MLVAAAYGLAPEEPLKESPQPVDGERDLGEGRAVAAANGTHSGPAGTLGSDDQSTVPLLFGALEMGNV